MFKRAFAISILPATIFLSACATYPGKEVGEISTVTQAAITEAFGESALTWDKSLAIKIANLNMISSGTDFIEGANVKIGFFYLRKTPISLVGIYIDGNKEPLVSIIKPGKSFDEGSPPYLTGKADNDCGGHYNAVVVLKTVSGLIANKVPFRTTVLDCGLSNG